MKLKHLAVLLALSTMAADCQLGDSTSPNNNGGDPVVGVYALQKLNGNNLPTNFNDGTQTVTVTAGSFTVNANGTFTYAETRSDGPDGVSGTWTKTGDTYTFNPTEPAGEPVQANGTATLTGTTLTLTVSEVGASTEIRTYVK